MDFVHHSSKTKVCVFSYNKVSHFLHPRIILASKLKFNELEVKRMIKINISIEQF